MSAMVHAIIQEKFNEWTNNLNSKEGRISIFRHIRDIPYGLIPGLIDPKNGPVGILMHNKGSCSPKHFLLGLMYEKLKIPIRYVTYPFTWDDPDIEYPIELRTLAQAMPLEYHIACKAYINNKWILLDTTWDPPLKRAQFPINENWDGISDTHNAVKPLDEIIHENVEQRIAYLDTQKARYTEKELLLKNKFYSTFNTWLEKLRMQKVL